MNTKTKVAVFVSVEMILFGGLVGAYVVTRAAHPTAFAWSHRLLDPNLGALNALLLLATSLAMAGAVHYAHRASRRRLALMLGLTMLGGSGFLAVKAVEYAGKYRHGLLWGQRFQPDRDYVAEHLRAAPVVAKASSSAPSKTEPKAAASGDATRGKPIFLGTCAACHGMEGGGIKSQGANLVASSFVGKLDDVQLLAFVKKGRQPFDADSTMHLAMPGKGGNPILNDQNLIDTIAFIRSLRTAAAAAAAAPVAVASVATVTEPVVAIDPNAPRWVDGAWWVPKSVIPAAAEGPRGLRRDKRPEVVPPADAHMFFGLFFVITGLHGLHVLAGVGLTGLLLLKLFRGRLSRVEFGGVYWHAVDLTWLVLFPLFYLVG